MSDSAARSRYQLRDRTLFAALNADVGALAISGTSSAASGSSSGSGSSSNTAATDITKATTVAGVNETQEVITAFKLDTLRTVKEKERRRTIEGQFFIDYQRDFGRPPTQLQINRHVWETELAAKIPFAHPDLFSTIYKMAFDYGPETLSKEITRDAASRLGTNNPVHVEQIEDIVVEAMTLRRDIFWLANGGFGNTEEDIRGWIFELVYIVCEQPTSLVNEKLDPVDLVTMLINNLAERVGLKVTIEDL